MKKYIYFYFIFFDSSEKFGLYHVNFSHPEKIRTPKLSAKAYTNIIKTNKIDWKFKPKSQVVVSAMAQRDDNMHQHHSSASSFKMQGIIAFIIATMGIVIAH
jgi:uncharacterized protein (DUF111 family)